MSLQSKRDFHKCACMRESRCWTFFHITGSGGQQRARRPASVMWPLSSMSWWSLESPGGRGGEEEKWVLAITPHLIFITPLTHTHPPIQRMERETIEMFLFENSTPNNMPPIPPNCVCACVCVCVYYLERESNTASRAFSWYWRGWNEEWRKREKGSEGRGKGGMEEKKTGWLDDTDSLAWPPGYVWSAHPHT